MIIPGVYFFCVNDAALGTFQAIVTLYTNLCQNYCWKCATVIMSREFLVQGHLPPIPPIIMHLSHMVFKNKYNNSLLTKMYAPINLLHPGNVACSK